MSTSGEATLEPVAWVDDLRAPRSKLLALIGVAFALALTLLSSTNASGSTRRTHPVPRLAHVVVVVFENEERSAVIGSKAATRFTFYANRYADLTDYHAVSHPSLPNYLALVSGSTHGVTSDCTSCGPWPTSIGTLLSRHGLSWGGYAEGYRSSSLFAKKHMPFLYFQGETSHVHPLTAFNPARLPAYAFVSPNLCNDGHNCPLSTADAFLAQFLPPLLRIPDTAVFVVFDEGTTDERGGGHIAAFVVGTAVKHHVTSSQPANHYTVLRTAEDVLRLPHLGASASTPPLTGIWRAEG